MRGLSGSSTKRSSMEFGSRSTRRPRSMESTSAASSPRSSAVAGRLRVVCRASARRSARSCGGTVLQPESTSVIGTAVRVPGRTGVTAMDAERTCRRNSRSV
ncbi:MAG: hypothetical protein M5U28_20330 [Sandaracinaceae bacterium]|nr:hypothetical protein [Sandaracinaceae bacterium]